MHVAIHVYAHRALIAVFVFAVFVLYLNHLESTVWNSLDWSEKSCHQDLGSSRLP